ncbi:Transmembrane emp24 domain-containing protein 10 [Triticum urartu]|uniref:Transmembrane emp24 domain-containing protein 10 n=1 Tax=Triticum urartu TaxID=4572 RepID=M7ZPB5_TRIUA|nr:Transmembrane emp24 domain-containing protein 10 [Triticum urartu]
MAVGKYSVVAPDPSYPDAQLPESHRVSLRVTSPYGNSMHYSENVQSGHFAFTAVEAGDYLACFWAPDHKPPVTVTFHGQGLTLVILSTPAINSLLAFLLYVERSACEVMMELELKKLEDTIKSIHEEMFYLREREEEMQNINRQTNSRMGWLSFLSLGICLSVAGLQLWHLKTFFERKKLL